MGALEPAWKKAERIKEEQEREIDQKRQVGAADSEHRERDRDGRDKSKRNRWDQSDSRDPASSIRGSPHSHDRQHGDVARDR